jgi:hypothetical protein
VLQTNTPKQLRDFGTQTYSAPALILHGIAQNITDLLLHRATMPSGAVLEFALDRLFQVANSQLSHLVLFFPNSVNV